MITLTSCCLTVAYSESFRQLTITDKRIGKVWKQTPFPDSVTITEIKAILEENKIPLHSLVNFLLPFP